MREGKPIPNGEIKENEEKENAIVKEDNNGIKEEDKEINEGKQKEVKKSKTPSCPVNAEGKPISVDQHWKQFVSKKATKKGAIKRSSAGNNKREIETTNQEPVIKKAKTLFDDDPEVEGRKKIPLRPKKQFALSLQKLFVPKCNNISHVQKLIAVKERVCI